MTREEAIKIIDCYDIGFYDLSGEKIPANKLAEAFDMAIEALSERNIARDIATILENEQDMRVMLQNEERPKGELVRCKDCRHRDLFSCPLADNDFQKDDDYCSWGERRK